MNGNFLLLANEIWIKLDRMIVDLKSLKRGFQDERNWHEDWDHREYETTFCPMVFTMRHPPNIVPRAMVKSPLGILVRLKG